MKRFLLSLCAVMILAVAPSSATVRSDGMGIDQDDTMDYGNIYAFPHLTSKYANILAAVVNNDQSRSETELLYSWNDHTIDLGFASGSLDVGIAFSTEAFDTFISSVSSESDYGSDPSVFDGDDDDSTYRQVTVPGAAVRIDPAGPLTRFGYLSELFYADPNSAVGGLLGVPDGLLPAISDPDQKLMVSYARPVGSGNLGVRLALAKSSNELKNEYDNDGGGVGDTESTLVNKADLMRIKVGYGQEEVGPLSSIDLGFAFTTNTAELSFVEPDIDGAAPTRKDYVERIELDGASQIDVRLRGIKDNDDGSSWIVNIGFSSSKGDLIGTQQMDADSDNSYNTLASADVDSKYTVSLKSSLISARVAYNYPVGDDGVMVLVFGVETGNMEEEHSLKFYDTVNGQTRSGLVDVKNESKSLIVPLAVGFEDSLNDTFVGRLGVSKNVVVKNTLTFTDGADYDLTTVTDDVLLDTDTTTIEIVPDEDATVSAGLGAVMGNFYADWQISTNILFNGPYLVTGVASSLSSQLEVGITF